MLHFDCVTYIYPHAASPAVRDIRFSLRAGEVMLCTGRSGCGKSTLARLANGLAPHYLRGRLDGEVRVMGHSTLAASPAQLARNAGTLFQEPERQFFALTVGDELAVGLQWRGWEGARIRTAVSKSARLLGIEDLLDQTIFGLSEGQKQKVALASLLAAGPRLLILDEPSANLDPEAAGELANILSMLKEQGIALFVVDHRLSWMRHLADKVLVLDRGAAVATGDFSLLDDAGLRERHGLRAPWVEDPRGLLPEMSPETADGFFGCRELGFSYPKGRKVFENANLSFAPGRVIALLGENGAGKTTLARLLTGLEKPAHGAIFAEGRPIKARALPGYVQVVLQNAGHQLRMNSATAELDDALRGETAKAEHQDRVRSCLDCFGIAHLAGRHPQSLSGGEQQRLAVACAAIRNPRVLILDEPTSGLDGENMLRMASLMRDMTKKGSCLLIITHDLELMHHVCTEKIVLQKHHQGEKHHENRNGRCGAQSAPRI